MHHFTEADRTRLAEFVPLLIRFDAIDQHTAWRWVNQLTDPERALLLM